MVKNRSGYRHKRDISSRDFQAFDELYGKYSKKLFYFCLGMLKDPEAADDMVQNVFITLWEKWEHINHELNIGNYIFTIACNDIRKHFRAQATKRRAISHIKKSSPGWDHSTENTLYFNELSACVIKAVEKMPPRRKKVFKLNRFEGMNTNEIASKLGITKRTAETHLAHAIKYLKKEVGHIAGLF